MSMPLSGTFRYTGVILADGPESYACTLHDSSAADEALRGAARFDNRLVGLQPTLALSRDRFVLTARTRDRAQKSSASLHADIGSALCEVVRGGDVLHVVRTRSADIGLAVVRAGQLVLALGAATAVEIGEGVSVRGGSAQESSAWKMREPNAATWVEVSVAGESARRLRTGNDAVIGDYRISVLRTYQPGRPGHLECLAITHTRICVHKPVAWAADRLCAPDAGLLMTKWPPERKPWWRFW
jgi:hypothetical protein